MPDAYPGKGEGTFMHIVLLSGGGGERLWPMSGETESKQFIPFFRGPDGADESMLQRVCRQAKSVVPGAGVTISTGADQPALVKAQLGPEISVCAEPERRDTFPAIALVCAYLRDEKKISEDECVVVCPVDPYVDESFYETFSSLERVVADDADSVTLIGIKPACPSDKYGYIIPERSGEADELAESNARGGCRVVEFKEKPDREQAAAYISRGGLWNAGVYAFRLGHVLDIVRGMTGFSGYDELRANYGGLEKTSFDYAVAEKEKNARVVRYDGKWLDVGTWDGLCDVLPENARGNAVIDESCENTHVINELDVPVLCEGLKDVVVVATKEGILVSDKTHSAGIKRHVELMKNVSRSTSKTSFAESREKESGMLRSKGASDE